MLVLAWAGLFVYSGQGLDCLFILEDWALAASVSGHHWDGYAWLELWDRDRGTALLGSDQAGV